MKFNPSWNQIVLIGLLLGAMITAHIIAPPAAPAIDSIAISLITAMAVNGLTSRAQSQAPLLSIVKKEEEQ
jgi:hypothetical protein